VVGVMLALGALMAALAATAPAATRHKPPVTVEVVGSLTLTWQGDPARGCVAQGLCGVSGSLQILPAGEESSSSGPPFIEVVDQNSVARVTDAYASGAPPATCADLVPVDFQLNIRQSAGGPLATVESGPSQALPSAGRCAGPTAGDLAALTLPARKLGSHGYDLSGQTSFGAGPFTVTAISTARILFNPGTATTGVLPGINVGLGSVSSGSLGTTVGRVAPGANLHVVFEEHAEVNYRITGLQGGLTTDFAALDPPLCQPLGACGTLGQLSQSFSAAGMLSFSGSRLVKRRIGSRAALAALRAGRLGLLTSFDGIPIEETAAETLTGPDGATCSDQSTVGPLTGQSSVTRGHQVKLQLTGNGEAGPYGPAGADPFRTRCPGPSAADVLGTAPLATATVPVSSIGARSLSLTFRTGGAFTGSAYAGHRSGSIVLSLVYAGASGGTHRFSVPSIPPLGP
jgi:hypothetical protein